MPGARVPRIAHVRVRMVESLRLALGCSQVGNDMTAVDQPEHVGRFEVAMDHARVMDALDTEGKSGGRRQWPRPRHRCVLDSSESQGLHGQRHHEIGRVVVKPGVQNRRT